MVIYYSGRHNSSRPNKSIVTACRLQNPSHAESSPTFPQHSTLQIPSLCADPFKTSAPIPYCSLFHRLKRSPKLIRPFRQLSSDSLQAFSRLSRHKIDLGRRAQHRVVSATLRVHQKGSRTFGK
ncbi:hypothetical protein CEXT_745071 [Caerostris extrusa]|uniref:Uncharacterized protein n=1 Tax=Caerostris extrusa TaxID=172846 RepID=A0AAV4S3I9_CAEEX|nr:hypothetical protein CEXT_745071 [Caerostris extrusa]